MFKGLKILRCKGSKVQKVSILGKTISLRVERFKGFKVSQGLMG